MHKVAAFFFTNLLRELEGGMNVVRQHDLGAILTACLDAHRACVHDHHDFGGSANRARRECGRYGVIAGTDCGNARFKLLRIEIEYC